MFSAIAAFFASWLKLWPAALCGFLFGFVVGCMVTSWHEASKQAHTAQEQAKADTGAYIATNALVGREAEILAPIWKNTLETSKQWSAYAAQNHNTDCQLPADAIRLRSQAAAPYPAGSGSIR